MLSCGHSGCVRVAQCCGECVSAADGDRWRRPRARAQRLPGRAIASVDLVELRLFGAAIRGGVRGDARDGKVSADDFSGWWPYTEGMSDSFDCISCALRELAHTSTGLAERAGEIERFASNLRTLSERLSGLSLEMAFNLEAGIRPMTPLGSGLLERGADTCAEWMRRVVQTLLAFDMASLQPAITCLGAIAAELEREQPPQN